MPECITGACGGLSPPCPLPGCQAGEDGVLLCCLLIVCHMLMTQAAGRKCLLSGVGAACSLDHCGMVLRAAPLAVELQNEWESRNVRTIAEEMTTLEGSRGSMPPTTTSCNDSTDQQRS